jgi:type II secretory pathway pseudopilin PulG
MKGRAILPLTQMNEIEKSKQCIDEYESNSGLYFINDSISKGHEIYYYIKGNYYLATNQLDSAEYLFRKELRDGKDLNNQIAGCKGLQELYEKKKISDSIAKYANWGYILNDSAYSLSEMQNIQKLQASYNYNHHKQKAEEKAREAQKAYYTIFFLIIVIVAVLIFGSVIAWLWYRHNRTKQQLKEIQYHQTQTQLEQAQSDLMELQEKNENASDLIQKKSKEVESLQAKLAQSLQNQSGRDHADLEDSLVNASITKELTSLLQSNPVQAATQGQMRELRKLVNVLIPNFYTGINSRQTLRPIEYEVCLLIRCHFKPAAISKLMGREEAYISNLRKGILLKAYGIKGSPKELDERIMQII